MTSILDVLVEAGPDLLLVATILLAVPLVRSGVAS